MNKADTVNVISHSTGIAVEKCISIVDSLEIVLTRQLEEAGGVRKFFSKIWLSLHYVKGGRSLNIEEGAADLIEKVAQSSETGFKESKQVLCALIEILNNKCSSPIMQSTSA